MILFDRSIYLRDAVLRACEDYNGLADIRMTEKEGQFCCDIANPAGDLEIVSDEFCNYVLNLTVTMGGHGD